MELEIEPIVDNWYVQMDKGQEFKVVAVDEDNGLIEIQHFDGDIEEISLNEWINTPLELCEEPQNWAAPLDIAELDDLGTEITDTSEADWGESLEVFRPRRAEAEV